MVSPTRRERSNHVPGGEQVKMAAVASVRFFGRQSRRLERQRRSICIAYGGGWQRPCHHRLGNPSPLVARCRRAIKTRSTSIARLQRAYQMGERITQPSVVVALPTTAGGYAYSNGSAVLFGGSAAHKVQTTCPQI
jgi:hypothetical protein